MSSWTVNEGGGRGRLYPKLSHEAGGFQKAYAPSFVICGNSMNTWSQHDTSVSINRGKTVCSWLNLLINKLTKKLLSKNNKYQCIRTKLSEVLILPSCIFCTSEKKKKEKSASDIKKAEYSHVINRDSFQLNITIFDIYFLHTSDW